MSFRHLKNIPSSELLSKTQSLVSEERRLTTEILWHIRELESRQVFSDMGYGSMFEMLTKHFHYSEGSAHRRLSASRLLRELPEIGLSLQEGKLSLTTISLAQSFFQSEKKAGKSYSQTAKQEVLKALEGKSRLEVERSLAILSPAAVRHEQIRAVSTEEVELKVIFTRAQMEKLDKLRMLLSHKYPHLTYAELIEKLADSELKRIDPERRNSTSPGEVNVSKSVNNRIPPAWLKATIWKRAQGQCEYVDQRTGRRCSSRYRLEIDHKIPFSLGGPTDVKNLCLLCKSHNLHAAIQILGLKTMQRYASKPANPTPHQNAAAPAPSH